jgi:hypothetical protein
VQKRNQPGRDYSNGNGLVKLWFLMQKKWWKYGWVHGNATQVSNDVVERSSGDIAANVHILDEDAPLQSVEGPILGLFLSMESKLLPFNR